MPDNLQSTTMSVFSRTLADDINAEEDQQRQKHKIKVTCTLKVTLRASFPAEMWRNRVPPPSALVLCLLLTTITCKHKIS